MSLTLKLPEDTEQHLLSEAQKRGLTVEQYVQRLLETSSAPSNRFKNGAEIVAFWKREDVIGSRLEIEDSQEFSRALRREAEHRFDE